MLYMCVGEHPNASGSSMRPGTTKLYLQIVIQILKGRISCLLELSPFGLDKSRRRRLKRFVLLFDLPLFNRGGSHTNPHRRYFGSYTRFLAPHDYFIEPPGSDRSRSWLKLKVEGKLQTHLEEDI